MCNKLKVQNDEPGFSLPELLMVVSIMGIFAMVTLMNPFFNRKHSTDTQTLLISDILQEARQRALNQRETMRVEIDDTKKQIRLINEKKSNTTDDDTVIKTLSISDNVVVGTHPDNVSVTGIPKTSYSIPEIVFSQSTYPLSINNQTFTLRFSKTGQVVDKGTDNTGSGAIMTGATIYVYEKTESGTQPSIVRALTVSGISGSSSVLKCRLGGDGYCNEWVK